ncbi:MAG TPA: integrase arm-type DNA-binding domain-containing protein, partial [Gammaproteobacteria bacterium]|nr:integrase arm-type DNA-binding domain-containing protein [Gammaproteobacteria bacterium]
MMTKLTAKKVENAKPRSKEYKLHDGEGLFLRIRPSGAKSWLFSFSLPGDRRLIRMTLSSIDRMSLKEARSILPSLHKLVASGIDPRNARAATQAENTQAVTMQGLFDSWIEFVKLTSTITPTWIKRHEDRWRLHLKKTLGNLFAKDVTRAHLAATLDAMSRKGIKEETRKALTTLNLMLDYGLTRHIIEHNPARMLKPKDFAATAARSRDRALSLPELRTLWSALDHATEARKGIAKTSSLSIITATAIRILILTGARRGEVAGMRWDELNLETNTWTLTADRTKNRKQHVIYLGEFSRILVQVLQPLTGNTVFVFDTGRNTGHIHTDSLTTAINRLKKSALLNELKSFTIHDLRRSAA